MPVKPLFKTITPELLELDEATTSPELLELDEATISPELLYELEPCVCPITLLSVFKPKRLMDIIAASSSTVVRYVFFINPTSDS